VSGFQGAAMEKFSHILRIGGVLLLLCPLQLAAAIYQWTDEHGRVHYSDRPVDQEAKEVQVRTAPVDPSQPAVPEERRVRQQRMLDAYSQERAAKKEEQEKAKQAREERKKKCFSARARYDEYSSAGSIYDYLESGERRYLEKTEREQFITRLKEDVARYCD